MGKTPYGGDAAVRRINASMQNQTFRRRKPVPSAHQKQIRFFTGLCAVIGFLFAAGIFWLVNRSYLNGH
jgi:hypothetical protein